MNGLRGTGLELAAEAERKFKRMSDQQVEFEDLNESNVDAVVDLIRRNLGAFEEVGSVLAASFRRTDNIMVTYRGEGACYLVARDTEADKIIGGGGLGPLAGLPASEGIGEIRELVLEKSYRGKGIGTRLVQRCLEAAHQLGYERIYLETTPQMLSAQKLFQKFGFRAVTHAPGTVADPGSDQGDFPCYFLLTNLAAVLRNGPNRPK